MAQIRRRAATTALMVDTSLNDQEPVGVLSLPVAGTLHRDWPHLRRNVASWNTRAASSRSEFVMEPFGFVKLTRAAMISAGHFRRHT